MELSSSRGVEKHEGSKGVQERYSFRRCKWPLRNNWWSSERLLEKDLKVIRSLKFDNLLKWATKCMKEKL